MHEISLMMSVIETVCQTAEAHQAEKVSCIRLTVGEKSGVVAEALRFAFDTVTRGTLAQGAELIIEEIPFMGQCLECGRVFRCQDFLVCAECGGLGKLISGKELQLTSIEID